MSVLVIGRMISMHQLQVYTANPKKSQTEAAEAAELLKLLKLLKLISTTFKRAKDHM